jgi:hypothetical protein
MSLPRFLIFVFAILSLTRSAEAQPLFPEKCIGTWKGMMHLYNQSTLRDSVSVTFTVARTTEANVWTWRTEYHSAKMPMTKDYRLKLKDATKKIFVTDEGGGLELTDYQVGNKLYSVFETEVILLTASYELRGDELIFEVTSGKKEEPTHPEVSNYSTSSVQRVVYRREK